MKQSFLLFLFLFSSLFYTTLLSAQIIIQEDINPPSPINEGNWLIGGNLEISNVRNNRSMSRQQLRIAPSIGYFLENKLLVGTTIVYGQSNLKGHFKEDFTVSVFEFNPLIRYYIGKQKIKPYLQLNGILRTNKFIVEGSSPFNNTFKSEALFGQIGADFFLSPNVAFNINLSGRIDGDRLNYSFGVSDEFIHTEGSDRFIFSAGMNFYLSSKKNAQTTQAKLPLVERYFKKGNTTLGLKGRLDFEPFTLLGSFYIKKFKNTKTRINFLTDTFFGRAIFGRDFGGIVLFRPEFERFIPLNSTLFFVPSLGPSLTISSAGTNADILSNLQFFPKFYFFFNQLILEAGFQVNTPFLQLYGDAADTKDWEGSVVFGIDYFLQDNLSLRGEAYLHTFGNQQFGYSPIYDVLPRNIFRIGVNYFIEK